MKKSLITATLLVSALLNANASANTDAAKTNYTSTQWEYYAAAEYAGGTGTEEDPYLIATAEQLMKLAVEIQNMAEDDNNWGYDYSTGKYWKQTADIVLNEDVLGKVSYAYGDASVVNNSGLKTFDGIGYYNNEYDYQAFAGVYDGNGHSISGMYITKTTTSKGVFNRVWGGTIKNLVVKDSYINANANIGFIAGTIENGSVVMNCQSSGIIYCGGSYHAGIVGYTGNNGGEVCQVLNCVSDAYLWAKNNVGGIVGKGAYSSVINNCYYGGWLGAVYSNTAKFQYCGAICSELGMAEATTQDAEGNTICENPSKVINSYWTDTLTVRHMSSMTVEAISSTTSTYGVTENSNAVSLSEISSIVETLNSNAENISGACGWKVGTNGLPELDFSNISSGINNIASTANDNSNNVYNIQGTLIKKGVSSSNVLEGLDKGIYIINGKKFVVR
ncbi:MAG: hypothetical protein Q4D41_03225 [Prevotellaceae bacterium]|nr:hypothetical protein [Prevotellaceae bacterium]